MIIRDGQHRNQSDVIKDNKKPISHQGKIIGYGRVRVFCCDIRIIKRQKGTLI